MILIGTPHTKGAGYFLNDKDLKTKQEADIQTCPHCQAIIKMEEWKKAAVQNFCMKCFKPTCSSKECVDCVPFLQKLDRITDARVKYAQFLKVAGLNPDDPPPSIITGI